MTDIYTHKDLASLCGVSETTIKSYRRKFPGFIPVLTRGKPIRFKKEAGDVCLKIRDSFAKGMSVNETHKVLKENFKEIPQVRSRRTSVSAGTGQPAAESAPMEGVSQEYMKKFFATAGQMMQGMAGLATAQVKAERRLQKVESILNTLVEMESNNQDLYARLLEQQQSAPSLAPEPASMPEPTPEPVVEPEPMPEPAPEPEPAPQPAEAKVRARKIVNVRGPEGEVKSYALEKDDPSGSPNAKQPSEAFLNTPIVIHNEQGEFLGVPGRLPLAGFVAILVREAEQSGDPHTGWMHENDTWIFSMIAAGGDTHALYFTSTTTPRGNLVVQLIRLDVNGTETTPQFLQEFFRQVKDKV
ncbi:helix-turn-helix domain-containing protein [Pseudodesulfovibrio sediminis]|uniref:MerR family transcriptional regulator n=1 Tax=Pseudodesulfovibrio sediminis TaxID=2810563 RepID=A0ABN6EV27_9BACT|nr:helix-turn-helix domain-containing protein [Pseudodesulfovibrio sediminis]BCS89060.1 MerR family transcriptional regulator [Pseudodesulfovibrio sediminis]